MSLSSKDAFPGNHSYWNITKCLNYLDYNRLFQLEVTYDNHLVQLPENFRAEQRFKLVIKGIVQMPFEH